MPPVKTPKQPKNGANDVLILFAKNLEEIRRYYRQRDAGRDLGHNIVAELIHADTATALSFAMEGKEWSAKDRQ